MFIFKFKLENKILNSDPNSESTPTQQGVEKWVSTQSKILRKGEDSLGDLQKILEYWEEKIFNSDYPKFDMITVFNCPDFNFGGGGEFQKRVFKLCHKQNDLV